MKKVFVVVACLALNWPVFSQNENNHVVSELKKVSELYQTMSSLSFDISYYYADELTPKFYVDSLKGSFKIQGNRFWYDLNDTEAMNNDNYVVMLFKEDLIMYLAKPAAGTKNLNPLSVLDSFLINNKDVKGSVVERDYEKKITISFLPGLKYKSIEYYINKKTGLIDRMINVVESSALYDEDARPLTSSLSSYAIVEVIFSKYQQGVAVEKAFNVSRYFKKEGDEYVPVSPYESYKIFLGSPNL